MLVSERQVRESIPPKGRGQGNDEGSPLQHRLGLDIDENGSPVTLRAAEWLVCFVPGLQRQWWHRFVPGWQHVFLIRAINDEQWLLFEPWWSRLLVSTLETEQALRFLRWADAGAVLKVRERIPGDGSQLGGWSNCAVLATFLLGRRYRLLSPNTLYRRLAAEPETRQVRVADELRGHFERVVKEAADRAFAPVEALSDDVGLPPRDQLIYLAGRIRAAWQTPRLSMIYRVARSQRESFPELASVLHELGTRRALACAEAALLRLAAQPAATELDARETARRFIDVVRQEVEELAARRQGGTDNAAPSLAGMVDGFLGQCALHGATE